MRQWFHKRSWITFFSLMLIVFGLSACGNDDGTVQPIRRVEIIGQITGSGGLSGVKISSGDVSTISDLNGFYQLENVPASSSGRIIITYEKDGYATYQKSLLAGEKSYFYVTAKLAKYTFISSNLDPASPPPVIEPTDPNDKTFQIVLPSDSLKGVPSGETVTVHALTGDPSTPEGKDIFPGDFMAAEKDEEEPSIPLESVVFAEITITDNQGNEYRELDSNKPATLRIRIPDSLQTEYSVNDEIEWWSYDEDKGVWIQEDADPITPDVMDNAVVIEDPNTGILFFEAKVAHFTWWNADRPLREHACVCVRVVDIDQNPLPGISVMAEGVTYNGRSMPAITDTWGIGCVNVKKSNPGQASESVRIWVEMGDLNLAYTVTDPNEGDPNTGAIYVQTDQGSTLDGIDPNECLLLDNDIMLGFPGEITGSVRRFDQSGPVVVDFTIYANFETLNGKVATATTDNEGEYILRNVPLNQGIKLYAPGYAIETVTIDDANIPAVVDFILPNQAPTIISLDRSQDEVLVDEQVTFTVSANDPDGDDKNLQYDWQVDAGDPNSGDGTSLIWTAPGIPGAVTVKVTVTDERGKSAYREMSFVVVSTAGETQLKVTVLDNPSDKIPVSGIYVILHNEDNKTIQNYKITDPNGVADFGTIGRLRATLTFLKDDPNQDISTYVNILVEDDMEYYFDYGDDDSPDLFELSLDQIRMYYGMEIPCQSPQANINVYFTGATGSGYPLVQPGFRVEEGFFDQNLPVPACEQFIQSDGKLSLLGQACEWGMEYISILKYGVLLDQNIVQDGKYTINLDKDPNILSWNANIGDTMQAAYINSLRIMGNRKGVPYVLGSFYDSNSRSSGTIKVSSAFPCDFYYLSGGAFDYVNRMINAGIVRQNSINDSLVIAMPDYYIDANYNFLTHTFSWSIQGQNNKDVLLLELESDNPEWSWQVFMDPNDQSLTSWSLSDLPSAITWLDPNDSFNASLIVFDFKLNGQNDINGFDDAWSIIVGDGIDPIESSSRILAGFRDINVNYFPSRR
ncbi:MAG: Ig-like domain-containing protein [bacterium]